MEAGYNGADSRLAYLFENANNVSFEPSLTAGTAVGTLTIDGEDTVLYAPTGGSASVAYTPIRTSGEAVGTLTIDETDYTVYAPNTAEDISYDPTDSGLTATDVQTAIDEIASVVPVGVTGSAGFHNCIYRGKYLGSALTTEQCANIANATFDDLFIGDYWTIDGVNYRIAAFDYYYNTGDTACTTHHVTVVPDTSLGSARMNSSNTTDGAYVGSEMYTTNMADAKNIIESAFGSDHILSHRQYLKNAVTDGYESGGAWYDSTIELMTEQNVYGGRIYANSLQGTNYADLRTLDKLQYPLFAFDPTMINTRQNYYLRDVATQRYFCAINSQGVSYVSNANLSLGIRPAFSIY